MSNVYSWTMTCSECQPYTIRVVSGEDVRNQSLDGEEFGLVGIHEDFPDMIPENEIWLGERVAIGELKFLLAGVMVRLQALQEGQSSDKAYEAGLKADEKARKASKGRFEGGEEDEDPRIGMYTTIQE